jgi:hypothetical protein
MNVIKKEKGLVTLIITTPPPPPKKKKSRWVNNLGKGNIILVQNDMIKRFSICNVQVSNQRIDKLELLNRNTSF